MPFYSEGIASCLRKKEGSIVIASPPPCLITPLMIAHSGVAAVTMHNTLNTAVIYR